MLDRRFDRLVLLALQSVPMIHEEIRRVCDGSVRAIQPVSAFFSVCASFLHLGNRENIRGPGRRGFEAAA